MSVALSLGLFLPLLGFLILMTASSWLNRITAGLIASSTVLLSFLLFSSLLLLYNYHNLAPQSFLFYNWIASDGIQADFSLYLDPLSLVMALIITGVGFLIHVYANGYMEHEEDFSRFFALMNFFVFAMLLLVLASNLLLLFVGWEGVGLASYLLIGFWYHRPSAAQAATKAFVMNRVGDLGLLLGILLTIYVFNTSNIENIAEKIKTGAGFDASLLLGIGLLYFIGAAGKSAQIPLHTWLPDAMEGPTPVSALIHAATMVTAGVYLVVRMHALYLAAPQALQIIGAIGGATSLFAALCAVGQKDLKRVLAYSTVSQLGLMFLACGIGAFYAAMFHLTTHAFVKALLFLSAGNVVHMMHGITNMNNMGGLSAKFPKTHWLFLIGALAMSGIPPFAAFFSKELILEQEHLAGFETFFYTGLAASILTAFYLMRAYCLTFLGSPRLEPKILHAVKEAPSIMLVPVSILAFLSILGGFIGFAFCKTPILDSFLSGSDIDMPSNEVLCHLLTAPQTLMAIVGAILGIGTAVLLYYKYLDALLNSIAMLRRGFYLDELYQAIVVRPLASLAHFINSVFETRVIQGTIYGAVRLIQGAAHALQFMQSGQIRSYAAWMIVGSAILIAYLVF